MIRLLTTLRGIGLGAALGFPVAYLYGWISFALGWYGPAVTQVASALAFGGISGALAGTALGAMRRRTLARALGTGWILTLLFFGLSAALDLMGASRFWDWGRELVLNLLRPGCFFVPLALVVSLALEGWLQASPIRMRRRPSPARRPRGEMRRYRL